MPEETKHTLKPKLWVKNYSDYLYNYAFYRVNNESLAEDMVQDTFLAALSAMDNFEGRSTEKTWLVSILKRKIIDHYRKKSTSSEEKIIDKPKDDGYEVPFIGEGNKQGHWNMERVPELWDIETLKKMSADEFMKVLQYCIARLPAKLAAGFTLKIIEELESELICKELEISSSNLWVMLHRARLQVRECLEKSWLNT